MMDLSHNEKIGLAVFGICALVGIIVAIVMYATSGDNGNKKLPDVSTTKAPKCLNDDDFRYKSTDAILSFYRYMSTDAGDFAEWVKQHYPAHELSAAAANGEAYKAPAQDTAVDSFRAVGLSLDDVKTIIACAKEYFKDDQTQWFPVGALTEGLKGGQMTSFYSVRPKDIGSCEGDPSGEAANYVWMQLDE